MHEFGIASSLIDAATETAAAHHAGRIIKLVVRIGALRQIDQHLLTEAFDHLRPDTICDGAALEILITDIRTSLGIDRLAKWITGRVRRSCPSRSASRFAR